MPFPSKPTTDDECYGQLLSLMSVGRYPGIYVLGSFARYATVYAQQVRALNLIDALAKSGVLSRYSKVAVVGGGIAGLTAAAAAAVRGAGSVSVFEKFGNTMRLQRVSEKRFLHPYIYDWPENSKKNVADLPIMGWSANIAANVVEQLDAQWNEIRAGVGGRLLDPRYNCKVNEVSIEGGKPSLRIEGGEPEGFDVVVLAVGFGLDAHAGTTEGYWADTRLDSFEVESDQSWFVSGYGDGALTDLMRLCIMDFRHGRVIAEVVAEVDESGQDVSDTLLKAEQGGASPDELARTYRGAAGRIAGKLSQKLKPRRMGEIWLNCSEGELFSPQSSVLNRLITAHLLNEGRFTLVNKGKILDPLKTDDGYIINFKDDPARMVVNNVIIRHGPDRALEKGFPRVWKAFRQIGEQWKSARQHEDWTRVPLYAPEEFDWKQKKIPPLRVDFGEKVGCVVITGSHTPKGLNQTRKVEEALRLLAKRTGSKAIAGLTIDTKPETISTQYALSSSVAYERTVRALCESDIAVFDITGREGAVMLFLGIRAAVRRGVTVTLAEDNSDTNPLPFNLASLNPIGMEADTEHITDAFDSGLAAFKAQPSAYLDLPAFDAVRRLGEDHRPQEPGEQILILRWFNPQYREMVRGLMNSILRGKFGEKTSIITTLDSKSPQLVEQRLYAAIRRTKLCIVDWTGWRPNVLFETGVRLAVNKTDPIFALCASLPPGWKDEPGSTWPTAADPSARALEEFFAPTNFTFDDYEDLRGRIETFDDANPIRLDRTKIPPGRTYQVVSESINRRDEPGGRPVSDLLMLEARGMAGPAVPEEGSLPVLFREALSEQVGRAATEYLLAVWFYLDGRYELISRFKEGKVTPADPHLVKLRQVGLDLKDRLRNTRGDDFNEVMLKVLAGWEVIKPTEENEDE